MKNKAFIAGLLGIGLGGMAVPGRERSAKIGFPGVEQRRKKRKSERLARRKNRGN